MKSRFSLISSGLYPETLPPCFVSHDAKRAFRGIVAKLDDQKFHEVRTEYIRYNGTKHDGSRRFFGTPNIISYFQISSFIWKQWKDFESNFALSEYSISVPKLMDEGEERAIKVPSLSELSKRASQNLKYAPYVLKADIAQCFPSLYTHAIPWAKHGIDASKGETSKDSIAIYFNALDFFVRNGQRGNTRGVLVGPDAYRLIAEFVLSKLDHDLQSSVGDLVVGAVRHVDDYYIGLRTEHDAQSVLSHLRESLATYEFNLNDQKTKILSSLEPINDLWAQRLRDQVNLGIFAMVESTIERAISEAICTANDIKSDSPIKILFRSFDECKSYNSPNWDFIEQNLQRIIQKHPHAIDYACLLVAKRKAIGGEIDYDSWSAVAEIIIKRALAFNHDHELLWMLWLLIVCDIRLSRDMVEEVAKHRNAHTKAFLVQAYIDGKIERKPKLGLGNSLSSVDGTWLAGLVAKSQGFTGASFSGNFAEHFQHLADKKIRLIDFDDHIIKVKNGETQAISRTRYGYDDDPVHQGMDALDDDDDIW